MAPDSKHDLSKVGAGSTLCQDLAKQVVDDFSEALIDMVENSTHGLSIEEIRAFKDRYNSDMVGAEQSRFKLHFQRCLNRREQEVFDPHRRHPFRRVLTMRFVDLFPPEGELDDTNVYLSRRVLPGLFRALEKMAGADPFANGHQSCMEAMERARNEDGIVVWEDMYEDAAALDAMDDLLMALVPHFDNPMKRVRWMLNLINNDLADPMDYDFEGEANRDWELDERGLINILRHLFRHLRLRLKDKQEGHDLTAKYGQARMHQLVALIKALDNAEV